MWIDRALQLRGQYVNPWPIKVGLKYRPDPSQLLRLGFQPRSIPSGKIFLHGRAESADTPLR
jgi:hypothetical protein